MEVETVQNIFGKFPYVYKRRYALKLCFIVGIVMYTLSIFGQVPPLATWAAALMLPLIGVFLLTCNTLVCWEILKTFNT